VVLAVGVFTVLTLIDLNKPAPEAIQVRSTASRWWGFHYDVDHDGTFTSPGDVTTATELIIPVGREVELHVTSNDVIHSFWIPALNGKRDAVPGQTHPWKLEASEPGVYLGQCTEFCGLSHANMRMLVRVVTQDDFDKWFQNQKTPTTRQRVRPRQAGRLGVASSSATLIGVNKEKPRPPPPSLPGVGRGPT
jgi:cytochrome c oxidase subunit 2